MCFFFSLICSSTIPSFQRIQTTAVLLFYVPFKLFLQIFIGRHHSPIVHISLLWIYKTRCTETASDQVDSQLLHYFSVAPVGSDVRLLAVPITIHNNIRSVLLHVASHQQHPSAHNRQPHVLVSLVVEGDDDNGERARAVAKTCRKWWCICTQK